MATSSDEPARGNRHCMYVRHNECGRFATGSRLFGD